MDNFTSVEQSKRLLELGVPRRSADEYRDQKGYRHSLEGILDVELFFQNFPDDIPCWSVGRLIEILKKVTERGFLGVHFNNLMTTENHVESLIHALDITFPRYKKRQEKADVTKAEPQVPNKVYHSIETLAFANKMYGEMLPTDDELVGMQDFLY